MVDRGAGVVRKLGIRPGHEVALVGAPPGWPMAPLPDGVHMVRRRPARPVDVVVAFFRRYGDLEKSLSPLSGAITSDGALWLAWPRRAGGHTSDITDNAVRGAALPLGLVDVKVAALDEDWSALKFVWRKVLRP